MFATGIKTRLICKVGLDHKVYYYLWIINVQSANALPWWKELGQPWWAQNLLAGSNLGWGIGRQPGRNWRQLRHWKQSNQCSFLNMVIGFFIWRKCYIVMLFSCGRLRRVKPVMRLLCGCNGWQDDPAATRFDLIRTRSGRWWPIYVVVVTRCGKTNPIWM